MTPIIEFENVTGIKGKFRLKDINFSLPSGYIMGLMGKNGAGKSTLMHYILEEKKLYSGTIRLNGIDIHSRHGYLKNKIGFVSEDNPFFEERTAEQNVEILSRFYEVFDNDIFKSAMKKMELSPKKTYGKMSRGERLKFQMAFAMAHKPDIYLIDEATAGMDPVFRMDFFRILQDVVKEETASVIMTSHIESEMERKTDYVGILEDGIMINFGESLDIIPQQRG